MSEVPTVGYYSLLAKTPSNTSTAYSWTSAPGQVSVPGVVQMTTADVLHAGLAAVGLASVTVPITISLAPDTAAITVNEGMSGLAVGMILAASSGFYAITPNGLQIIDVNTDAGTILCNSGGQAMAGFGVTFADAGIYLIEVAYQSYDSGYANTSGSLAVTVS